MENAPKYFSTKFTVKMMGMRYIPSVCYKLDEVIGPAVEKLAAAGEAYVYPEKVRFINGVAIPVKKPERQVVQKALQSSREDAAANTDRRSSRKGGRAFD